jgi:hypothetical protein
VLDSLLLAESQRRSLAEATQRYAAAVDQAAAYLVGRGIGREAAIGSHLGFVADPVPGHERFAGMLSIPYLTVSGPVAIKFRRLQGEGQKYDGPAGQHRRLYNARACSKGGPVVAICEGELDAVCVESNLGIPAVAAPGVHWADHWSRCFADFDRIVVFADNDLHEDGSNPGKKHGEKLARTLSAEMVLPPVGCDVSDWIALEGADVVREAAGL